MALAVDIKRRELEDICRRHSVRRLELFGSAARHDFEPQRSDLDFLVEFQLKDAKLAFDAYFGLKEDLETLSYGRSRHGASCSQSVRSGRARSRPNTALWAWVRKDQHERIIRRLDAMNAAESVDELDVPGFGMHKLRGKPPRIAITVNGPWRITFEWKDGDAYEVDLEQYH